jgi:hypothetical protein
MMETCQVIARRRRKMWRWKKEKTSIQSLLGCGHLVGNVITELSKINVGS